MRTVRALAILRKADERPTGYDLLRTPVGQEYQRRAQLDQARVEDRRAYYAKGLSLPHLRVAQRRIREAAAEQLLDVNLPVISKYDAHTLASQAAASTPVDRGLARLAHQLRMVWERDPLGSHTVADLERLRRHYAEQYPRSSASALVGQHFPRRGYASEQDVRGLVTAAARIGDQAAYDRAVVDLGINGEDIRAVRARALLRDLVNRRLADDPVEAAAQESVRAASRTIGDFERAIADAASQRGADPQQVRERAYAQWKGGLRSHPRD